MLNEEVQWNGDIFLKSPFPYFGGKSRVSDLVWQRFGDVPNYVEPFAGSLAVLLMRPHNAGMETVNDIDCYIANFWRALQNDPETLAKWADSPVNEADLHARHLWLVGKEDFRERMKTDPDYFDAKIAGWWVWGICQWIGSGWCDSKKYFDARVDKPIMTDRKRPHLGNAGKGVHRPKQQLPHLGNAGRGVHRPKQQLPHLGNAGTGVHRKSVSLYEYMLELSERLRRVRVACGDWTRVLGDSVTFKNCTTGIFLDPPYAHAERDSTLYANESDISSDVRQWAIDNGNNSMLRIALCGYEGEHSMPDDWECVPWKANGGYSRSTGKGRENAGRERIWFSPHCLKPVELPLFAMLQFDNVQA